MLKVVFLVLTVFFSNPEKPPKTVVVQMSDEATCLYSAKELKKDVDGDGVRDVEYRCVVLEPKERM